MSATSFYGVSLLEGQEAGPDTQLVFEDRIEALKVCKKFKGARFKCFTEREEAIEFTRTKQTITEPDGAVNKDQPTEKLPYPTPSPQEMLAFRRAIESGNHEELLHMAWQNPRFLISAGDTPTMIRERYRYHGLLLGAFKKEFLICKSILDTITDANFIALLYTNDTEEVRKSRMFYLLDTYLNTPDKFLNETALHFASKFGSLDIVELLLSYPECDRERKNTKGESPIDIVCAASRIKSAETEAQIKSVLSQRFFIPVLRPADFSSPAQIGKPWSPDVTVSSPESSIHVTSPLAIQHKYPTESQMKLQALAGPMSPKEADIFYHKMKTPPVRQFQSNRLSDKKMTPIKMVLDCRLSDMDKGVERVGRNLARDLKVPWCEYWSFLDEFCDLASPEGLQKLEEYFREGREKADEMIIQQPIQEISSPLSELCLKLDNLHLQSPTMPDPPEEFFTPPSTPPSTFYEIPPFYISGSQPSKVDVDVLRALERENVDFADYPNISMWKENMMQYNQEHLNRLRTPATGQLSFNNTLRSPLTDNRLSSPRISSLASRLNSPRKTHDFPVMRLFSKSDDEDDT